MGLTARKVKRLRRDRKVAEKIETAKMLMRLGAEQKELLARLGQQEKPATVLCVRCGRLVEARKMVSMMSSIPLIHDCRPSKQFMKWLSRRHDKIKFLNKMGFATDAL